MNVAAPRVADALAVRIAQLRQRRRGPGWATELLDLTRDLTMASAGAVLAEEEQGWVAIAPDAAGATPPAWAALAAEAVGGRGVVAATVEGRWLFAATLGPADPPGGAVRRGALVIQVDTTQPMELALTRERIAFLGALAEGTAVEAQSAAQTPSVLASVAAEALLKAPDRVTGLHRAAGIVAQALPGAERVAIVLLPEGELGLSDQPTVERGTELAKRLVLLASEAGDRGTPRIADELPTPGERAFAESFGARPLLTVPAAPTTGGAPGLTLRNISLVDAPGCRAALVVAFAPGTPIAEDTGARLVPAATLLGGVARTLPRQVKQRHPRRLIAVAAVLSILAVLPRRAEVAAPVVLQPERLQSVTAPYDGILEASTAQPGDRVGPGSAPLAKLITREIELDLAAARARAANDRRDAAIARAQGHPAQEQIALLSARRTDAQVSLLEYRLGLASITAPTEGVIVSGDLRRSLGQPVGRGQVLFEIAPDGPLRAEVLVLDEHVPAVRPGQRVRLSAAAEPGRVRVATVERVRPMAELVDGRNVFRVIARLESSDTEGLRPGMEGWARVQTGTTTWLFWLLRDPVRWLRRQVWL